MTTSDTELANRFRKLLDRHGYGFQFAVVRKINELFEKQQKWLFEVSEFPVQTSRYDTRIDFIIRPQRTRFFLAAECKRANPSLSDWCFVRSPYLRRNRRSYDRIFVEEVQIKYDSAGSPRYPSAKGKALDVPVERAYHIGFEVKNQHATGDPGGSPGRAAIEEAAGQALKGINGLAMALSQMKKPRLEVGASPNRVTTLLMPAIFTTARLWTSDVDLSAADLLTGTLPSDLKVEERPWLLLQYPCSPGLRHSLASESLEGEFADVLEPEYTRTIAVVNAGGIETFLRGFPYPD